MCYKNILLWKSKGPNAPEADKVSQNPTGVLKAQTLCCSSCRETRGSAGADPQGHVPGLLCLCILGGEDLRPALSGCLEDGYVWCPAWERGGKDLVEKGRDANTPNGACGKTQSSSWFSKASCSFLMPSLSCRNGSLDSYSRCLFPTQSDLTSLYSQLWPHSIPGPVPVCQGKRSFFRVPAG